MSNLPADAQHCFGSNVRVCLERLPTAAIAITADLVIDTNTYVQCDPGTTEYCVVAATTFSIAANTKFAASATSPWS